jgi:hypothetical protein
MKRMRAFFTRKGNLVYIVLSMVLGFVVISYSGMGGKILGFVSKLMPAKTAA